eukprot:GHVS01068697.1.p1 GENE.GHVS01068697.1~~GHVS01068697.1.p1  ORF type:complete len:154 (+),score=10.98 GHVS01068697.1:148-609(+)
MPDKTLIVERNLRAKALVAAQRTDGVTFAGYLYGRAQLANQWNDDYYVVHRFGFFVIFEQTGDMVNFRVVYLNDWGLLSTQHLVEIMSTKLDTETNPGQAIQGPLVFDESCREFAPLYLPGGQSISAELAELPAVRELGDVAAWSKTFKPVAE